MTSLVAYGAYVPYFRLRRSAIATVLGGRAAGGTRAVASYDEDSTTLGVEAARAALAAVPEARGSVRSLLFATATPPYLDKTNAAAIHAALGLAPEAMAVDMAERGAVRSRLLCTWRAAAPRTPWWCSRTYGRDCPEAPTNATGATRGRPSSSAPGPNSRRSPR